jgi:hypothetical protein
MIAYNLRSQKVFVLEMIKTLAKKYKVNQKKWFLPRKTSLSTTKILQPKVKSSIHIHIRLQPLIKNPIELSFSQVLGKRFSGGLQRQQSNSLLPSTTQQENRTKRARTYHAALSGLLQNRTPTLLG